jgi:hypothetical protein
MKDSCFSVSQLLEKYFDREATDQETSLVETHLLDCASCRETIRSMGELSGLIKAPVEEAIGKEDFPWIWQNIQREIRAEEKPGWWETLRSSLSLSPFLRRKVWVPVLAIIAIAIFITAPFVFEEIPSSPGLPVVEYVESETHNVMIYQMEKAKVTVIWLFEGPESERPAS